MSMNNSSSGLLHVDDPHALMLRREVHLNGIRYAMVIAHLDQQLRVKATPLYGGDATLPLSHHSSTISDVTMAKKEFTGSSATTTTSNSNSNNTSMLLSISDEELACMGYDVHNNDHHNDDDEFSSADGWTSSYLETLLSRISVVPSFDDANDMELVFSPANAELYDPVPSAILTNATPTPALVIESRANVLPRVGPVMSSTNSSNSEVVEAITVNRIIDGYASIVTIRLLSNQSVVIEGRPSNDSVPPLSSSRQPYMASLRDADSISAQPLTVSSLTLTSDELRSFGEVAPVNTPVSMRDARQANKSSSLIAWLEGIANQLAIVSVVDGNTNHDVAVTYELAYAPRNGRVISLPSPLPTPSSITSISSSTASTPSSQLFTPEPSPSQFPPLITPLANMQVVDDDKVAGHGATLPRDNDHGSGDELGNLSDDDFVVTSATSVDTSTPAKVASSTTPAKVADTSSIPPVAPPSSKVESSVKAESKIEVKSPKVDVVKKLEPLIPPSAAPTSADGSTVTSISEPTRAGDKPASAAELSLAREEVSQLRATLMLAEQRAKLSESLQLQLSSVMKDLVDREIATTATQKRIHDEHEAALNDQRQKVNDERRRNDELQQQMSTIQHDVEMNKKLLHDNTKLLESITKERNELKEQHDIQAAEITTLRSQMTQARSDAHLPSGMYVMCYCIASQQLTCGTV
jgi:hypothetical protein